LSFAVHWAKKSWYKSQHMARRLYELRREELYRRTEKKRVSVSTADYARNNWPLTSYTARPCQWKREET
jgi:hypothetical protein